MLAPKEVAIEFKIIIFTKEPPNTLNEITPVQKSKSVLFSFKMKLIKLLVVLIVAFGITYFILDQQLYFYGKNILWSGQKLPLNITPESNNELDGGFVLRYEYGFSLVSKGEVKYVNTKEELNITDIIKYGFVENELVAQVKCINNEYYIIKFTKNNDKKSKQDLRVNIYQDNSFVDFKNYSWVDVKDSSYTHKIVRINNFLFLIIIALMFSAVFLLLTIKQKRKAN